MARASVAVRGLATAWLIVAAWLILVVAQGCGGKVAKDTGSSAQAIGSGGLQLSEETYSCANNQVIDAFDVVNGGSSQVKLSDITIKYWANDTTPGVNMVAAVNYGGCLNSGTGCFHQVTGVTASVNHFSPACGPQPSQQANWEITISNSDPTLVSPGVTWASVQATAHLANFGLLNPGASTWYSPCVGSSAFTSDVHYAIYVQGNLVGSSGGMPPSCRSSTPPVLVDTGGDVPLSAHWVTTPGAYPSSQFVFLQIANPTHPSVNVALTLVGSGLDSRVVRRPFDSVTVANGSTITVKVPIADLPVQSVGTQTATTMAMTFFDGHTTRTLESPPLLHEFADTSFASLLVYDEYGKPILNQSPESYFGTDLDGNIVATSAQIGQLLQQVGAANTNLVGRYWDIESLQFVTLGRPTGSFFIGGTMLATGKLSHIVNNFATGHTVLPEAVQQFCYSWRVHWVDEGYAFQGASEAVQSTDFGAGHRFFPARFARVSLTSDADPTHPIFSDYLDENGCGALPGPLAAGGYTLIVVARMQAGSDPSTALAAVVEDRKCTPDEMVGCACGNIDNFNWTLDGNPVSSFDFPETVIVSLDVVTPVLTSPNPFLIASDVETRVGEVAAVYGQLMVAHNTGMLPSIAEPYHAFANQVCPEVDPSSTTGRCIEACFQEGMGSDESVYLSYEYIDSTSSTPDLGNPTARWKFGSAHEIGHQMQWGQIGAMLPIYDRPTLSPPPPLLCDCTGLNPTGNTEHCLQSTEQQTTAQLEGFAHFSSANVWNDPSASSCTFTYYKGVRDDSLAVNLPPFPVSCIQPVKWTENHCPIPTRAAEYDWLGFYTAIARDPQAPILQPDLSSVYRRLCSDEGNASLCSGAKAPWSSSDGINLPTAAEEVFGPRDPRTAVFNNDGVTYGVTR